MNSIKRYDWYNPPSEECFAFMKETSSETFYQGSSAYIMLIEKYSDQINECRHDIFLNYKDHRELELYKIQKGGDYYLFWFYEPDSNNFYIYVFNPIEEKFEFSYMESYF